MPLFSSVVSVRKVLSAMPGPRCEYELAYNKIDKIANMAVPINVNSGEYKVDKTPTPIPSNKMLANFIISGAMR